MLIIFIKLAVILTFMHQYPHLKDHQIAKLSVYDYWVTF